MADTAKAQDGLIPLVIGIVATVVIIKMFKTNVSIPLATKKYIQRLRIGKLNSIRFVRDQVQFKFPIENPNNNAMTIKAIVGDLNVIDAQGRKIRLGMIAHYGGTVIQPLHTTDFDLVVKVNQKNEFIALSNLFQGRSSGLKINFDGNVNTDGNIFPVQEIISV